MVSFLEQIRILLWKNWTLRKRNIKRVLIEILWPLSLFIILMWVRTRGLKYKESSCHVVEKALPSVGGFEFIQNFICTLNNTCYDDYVENNDSSRWDDAIFVKFVKDTTPLLTDILRREESRDTVTRLSKDAMDILKIFSSFKTAENLENIGSLQLRDYIPDEGLTNFYEAATTYSGLSREDADEFLNITIKMGNAKQDNIDALLDIFRNPKCETNKSLEILTSTSQKSVKKFCKLGQEKLIMLLFVYGNYLDRDALLRKLNSLNSVEQKIEQLQSEAPMKALRYDFATIGKLRELGRKVMDIGQAFDGFTNMTVSEMASIFAYQGICGFKQKGNATVFGFDPGLPSRFDSLRDQLRDVWKSDVHYENDPEISPSCNAVFQRLESMPITSFMWRQIKPMMRGYIFYAPDTEITRMIMNKVEDAFGKLQEMEFTVNSILQLLHRIRLWVHENLDDLNGMKSFLGNQTNIDNMVQTFGNRLSNDEIQALYKLSTSLDAISIEDSLERIDFVSELLSEIIGCVRYNKTRAFPTEWQAVNAGYDLLSSEKLWAVIVFTNVLEDEGGNSLDNSSFPPHIYYKIRMDSDKVDGTRAVRDRLTSKGPRRRPLFDLKYITYGFIYLQEMIERSIIELVTGDDLSQEHVYLQQNPYPCYIVDQFIRRISRTFPLFMVLSWVYASSMIIKSIVLEKELRLREVMKIMGVSNAAVWTSWFLESFVITFISCSVLTLILKYGKVLEFSNPLLIWLFLISYTIATICFSFLISTFFSRANSAAAAGGVIFFVSHLPYNMMLIWEDRLEWFETMAGCLISNVAFGFGCTYFARYEQDGVGAQWSNLSWQSLPGDDFNLAYCIAMMWFDSILYLILTWYVEAVFPGEYGVPKPWNFFCQLSYWVSTKPARLQSDTNLHEVTNSPDLRFFNDGGTIGTYLEGVELEPGGEQCGVRVVNLSKTYSNGKSALENLSINFYENQITSFLGHNGAGKTTTISILTGLFPPTEGTAIINGMDIRSDMDRIRRNLGICPQYNVLFDRLNVYEHLKFYALLKGKKGKDVEAEFDEMLVDLGIPHKRKCYPSALSGGMKRKLSVAIAFVGGSKTVFLDEPTSGVDPFSRRSIWELLLKYKHGRTVILTTHFMDEADILGDRIAIISQGKLKALGSSLFLKSHFGQGYTLHLVKVENFQHREASIVDEANENLSRKKSCLKHDSALEKFVRDVVPDAVITESVGCEIAFLLPYTAIEKFSILFSELNMHLDSIGILSYGISDTSLEDVFLKITMTDLMANTESFHVLSSSCKRRIMHILDRCKNRLSFKNNVVTTLPTRVPSDTTNTTAVSIQPFLAPASAGDFGESLGDIDIDNQEGKYSDRSTVTASIPDRKSRDTSFSDSVSSDVEAVTTSLLDEPVGDGCAPSSSTSRQKVKTKPIVCCLWCVQIYMIIKKRLWNSKRNIKAMFFEIILPAVFIAITLAFTLILPPATDEPPREITPWTYPAPNNIFFSEPNITRQRGVPREFRTFINELIGPIGMGTACVDDNKGRLCDAASWKNETVQRFNASRQNSTGARFDSCSCEIGSMVCPRSVDKVSFPKLKTQTNDYVLDVSNTNVAEWILKTYEKYMDSRYGGFELSLRKPSTATLANYLNLLNNLTNLIPLPKLEPDRHGHEKVFVNETPRSLSLKPKRNYKIWFENRGWISSVAYLNALHNMWLRARLPDQYSDHKTKFGITLITHPMNLTKDQSKQESLKTAGLGVIHAICIIFALSFIPASFTVYLIEERKCGGKHLHLVSGVRPLTYWIGNFIFDMGKYVVPISLCVILFKIFDAKAYIGAASFWSFLCLLLLYGWASIPSMYPFSFLFGIPSTAFVVLACSNLFLGVITTVSTFVLEQFGDEELEAVGKVLEKVFLVFPHYCLGRGCIELVKVHALDTGFSELTKSNSTKTIDRFEWEHLGEKLFFLGMHGFVYFLINLVFEYKHLLMLVCKLLPMKKMILTEDDVDVMDERQRVENSSPDEMTLRAINLTKFYKGKKHPAVNGITFGIKKGECFGLLGVNGAGKSSTFKMLTGDARISSGSAIICEADVETSLDKARKHFGYCPQEDSIDPLLTGYELLTLYGRLRGLNPTDTKNAAERLIKTLGLTRYANRSSGTYSGGNKRKLSTAIALIGDPDALFLDEPTSGMDPGARRDLWKVILDLLHNGKTVVLTSHSMEECEVLCTKIAIMVNGQFKCLGSLQHLKNRFGKGYTLTIRCAEKFEDDFLKRISIDLPMATVEDQHCSQLKLNIPQESAQLNEIFSALSMYKNESIIEDYSVSQTTLDDIFVRFASDQKDALDR